MRTVTRLFLEHIRYEYIGNVLPNEYALIHINFISKVRIYKSDPICS